MIQISAKNYLNVYYVATSYILLKN